MSILKDEKEIIDQVEAVVKARLKDREVDCARRENRLCEARFDIEHLLDLMSDLGHPKTAARMRVRFERNGVL